MKRPDHRSLPSAKHYNDVVKALGQTTRVQTGLSSSSTAPVIGHALTFQPYWTWDQITCTGINGVGWMPKREPYTYETINGASVMQIYGVASEFRRYANESVYNLGVLEPGHYGLDLRAMPTGWLTYSGGDPDSDIATYAVGHVRYYDGTTTQTYDYNNSSVYYQLYYTHDPCKDGKPAAVFGDGHNEATEANFPSENYCADVPWSFWWNVPEYDGPAGSIMAYGPEGEGVYDRLGASVWSSFGDNYVGATASLGLDETVVPNQTYYIGNAAARISGTGTPIDFCQLLKSLPDGATIVSAKMEVLTTGLVRTWWSNTRASYEDPLVYTLGTSTSDVGFVLLGRSIDSLGTEHWTPLGGCLGGSVSNGLWQVIDATGLFQRLLALRSSTYASFAIMPSLASQYLNMTDARSILRGMCSNITWGVHLEPTWEGSYFANGDVVYETANSGEYVTWENVQVGTACVEFKLTSGQLQRAYVYGNMVRMDAP